jgi:hypothetical protein
MFGAQGLTGDPRVAMRLAERRVLVVPRSSEASYTGAPLTSSRMAQVWQSSCTRITGNGETGVLGGAVILWDPNS